MAQKITIKIADRPYTLSVNSEEHEELIRKAADDINRKVGQYLEKFPNRSIVELLSFVALNVSMANFTLVKQMKEMKECEEMLDGELGSYLENIDKNSR